MIDKNITYDQLISDINALPSSPSADQLATYDVTGDGVLDAGDARYHMASQPLQQLTYSPGVNASQGAAFSSGPTPDERLREIMSESGTELESDRFGRFGRSLEGIMNDADYVSDTGEKLSSMPELYRDLTQTGEYAPEQVNPFFQDDTLYKTDQVPNSRDEAVKEGFDFGAPANVGDMYNAGDGTIYTYQEKSDGMGGSYSGWDITQGSGGTVGMYQAPGETLAATSNAQNNVMPESQYDYGYDETLYKGGAGINPPAQGENPFGQLPSGGQGGRTYGTFQPQSQNPFFQSPIQQMPIQQMPIQQMPTPQPMPEQMQPMPTPQPTPQPNPDQMQPMPTPQPNNPFNPIQGGGGSPTPQPTPQPMPEQQVYEPMTGNQFTQPIQNFRF